MVRFDRNPYIGKTFVYECDDCRGARNDEYRPCQVRIADGIMEDETLCVAIAQTEAAHFKRIDEGVGE